MGTVCNLGNTNAYKPDAVSRHPLYYRWKSMINRCADLTNKNYGGRGITVCDEWQDFETFIKDMDEGFSPELTLDRRENDKGYSKANCRWVDRKVQAKNTRRSFNVPEEIEEVLKRRGISFAEYGRRIKAGVPHLEAIKRHKKKNHLTFRRHHGCQKEGSSSPCCTPDPKRQDQRSGSESAEAPRA